MSIGELGSVLRLSLILVASVTFIILGVAAAHFFRRPATVPGVLRTHQAFGIVAALAHIAALALTRGMPVVRMAVAGGVYVIGLALFVWSQETVKHQPPSLTFAGVEPAHLVRDGAYAWMRHPFAVAFICIWLAAPLATFNTWVVASGGVMAASYVVAAYREEQAFLRSPLARDYRIYRATTAMFVPGAQLRPTGRSADGGIGTGLLVLVVVLVVVLTYLLVRDVLAPLGRH